MYRSFEEIRAAAGRGAGKTIAVAAANDATTLSTFAIASQRKLARGILVGDEAKIRAVAKAEGLDLSGHEVVHVPDEKEAALVACGLVREGKADVLMKGMVKTSTFLKAVLDHERGLRSGKLLSHVFVYEDADRKRLVLVTDGGINIRPSLDEKAEIVRNAVALHRAMGGSRAKVAALAAVEMVNEKMPETVEAAKLQEMAAAGDLGACDLQGPLALDVAVCAESARVKGLEGPVVGEADVLLAPDIASGNILGKSLIYYGTTPNAGTVVGTTAPVIFLSRADDEETKLNSIALCLCVAERMRP